MRSKQITFIVVLSIVVVIPGYTFAQSDGNPPQRQANSDNSTPDKSERAPTSNNKSSGSSNCAFTLSPTQAAIAPGGTVTFTASFGKGKGCSASALVWSIDEAWQSLALVNPNNTSAGSASPSADLTIKATRDDVVKALKDDPSKIYIHVTAAPAKSGSSPRDQSAAASDNSSDSQAATAQVTVETQSFGNIVIPIIGFEQAGASAAQSAQKFFFNLFVSRPLPFGSDQKLDDGVDLGTRFRWFGNVRIASYAQQISSNVAEFATGFAAEVGQLKVNQLAQSGEFNMGLEYRPWASRWGLYGIGDPQVKEYSTLSFIAGFGAISPLSPSESLQIFVTPPVGSPQRGPFLNQFPSSANSTYTAFTTPDRGRFYWEYGAGLRLTTMYFDHSNVEGAVSPAMLTYTLGQNQIVSGGVSSGVVQRIEGFLPLPRGQRFAKNTSIFYLFGRVDMRLASPRQTTPFILQPAPSTVNAYDSDVNIIAAGSTRDIYTIGVGVDALKLIKAIAGQNTKTTPSKSSDKAVSSTPGGSQKE